MKSEAQAYIDRMKTKLKDKYLKYFQEQYD